MDWNDLDYETRLNVTEHIFKAITEEPCCSFRRLIYNRLGFSPEAYCILYHAGGMTITNAMVSLELVDILESTVNENVPDTQS